MTHDYKTTVFLPQTDFAMRGNLPQKEPEILAFWERIGLYEKLHTLHIGAEKFVLHDGPPYANGNLHIGHALNKILKDIINRYQRSTGKQVSYVPGWDCHGLPIEWKIEEEYRASKKNKDDVPVLEFREQCRQYAAKWVEIQKEEFKRLGIDGNWQQPYTTMTHAAEAQIVRELHQFLMNDTLYQGFKPVMWSVVEQTALAEAEVEYQDKVSTEVYVKFKLGIFAKPDAASVGLAWNAPIDYSFNWLNNDVSLLIWTTTPWTLPANAAVAFNPAIPYALINVKGERFLIAQNLVVQTMQKLQISEENYSFEKRNINFQEIDVRRIFLKHALSHANADGQLRKLHPADFVTDTDGTGFVHIAPAHGEDDFLLAKQQFETRYDFPQILNKDGTYKDTVPDFAGMHIFKDTTTQAILDKLRENNALLYSGTFTHSYPHSWRSKKPLIYLATPQWFIGLDKEQHPIRTKALTAIEHTTFYPPQGKNRIRAMVEGRPDWCVSRQRAWGVPIMVLVDSRTNQPLRDAAINARIAAGVEAHGADYWYTLNINELLADTPYAADAKHYEKVSDILDVWFDSGSTHSFVLEDPSRNLQSPADLYLEGSDQHRGWFQSSLLESVGTRGRAPYKAVLTHGFCLDEQGRKMSKSLGNVTAPQEVISKYGADILRLWVVGADYYEDLRIGKNILEQNADLYRRLRNTLRYILGGLHGYSPTEAVPHADMPALEQYILHRVHGLAEHYRACATTYAFSAFYHELHAFCAGDLSAFYFDIRKDSLYCDAADDPKRRACRTVLQVLFEWLTYWLSPVLCFTAEEAWQAGRTDGDAESVHLRTSPDLPVVWRQPGIESRWERLRDIRRAVNVTLEAARADKTIGASLQASPKVTLPASDRAVITGIDLAELCITSGVTLDFAEGAEDITVTFTLASGEKCQRCWKVTPEVGQDAKHPVLCGRCTRVVG